MPLNVTSNDLSDSESDAVMADIFSARFSSSFDDGRLSSISPLVSAFLLRFAALIYLTVPVSSLSVSMYLCLSVSVFVWLLCLSASVAVCVYALSGFLSLRLTLYLCVSVFVSVFAVDVCMSLQRFLDLSGSSYVHVHVRMFF